MKLQNGSLSAQYAEGELRNVTINGQPILLRLYAAVRDENWGTISGVVESESVVTRTHMQFTVCHADLFRWTGTITLAEDGTLTFAFEGEALKDFQRNRIGFCLLHPAQSAGDRCLVAHTNGTKTEAILPKLLCPDQPLMPFSDMAGLTQTLPDGTQVVFSFSGDVFEMEDQRNWTDASFKTFCTPLALPYPVEAKKGDIVRQGVRISFLPPNRRLGVAPSAPNNGGTTLVDNAPRDGLIQRSTPIIGGGGGQKTALGLALSPWSPPLTDAQLERLKALKPAHLRVDVFPLHQGEGRLREAVKISRIVECPLEVAFYINSFPTYTISLDILSFSAFCQDTSPDIVRWLLFIEKENINKSSYENPIDFCGKYNIASKLLSEVSDNPPIFLGTDSDFIFVNRFPPPQWLCDGLTFAINPQVHAFDEESILETIESYPALLATAHEIAQGKPVIVSALTFLPRWNPYAATPLPRFAEPRTDNRQYSEWGVKWFLEAIAALQAGGVSSITVAETHGPRGVLGTELERIFSKTP
jgi:D-apionolactonase